MNQPSVSIIIPVYNVEPYVEDCIRSVIRQTYGGKMECIVVDDCGTDNSMDVVERVIGEYNGPIPFRILHHEHNRGISAARNTGMDAATGDYLFFLDSDDELTDDCIEKLTEPLVKEWYDVVIGNVGAYHLLSSGKWEKKSILQIKIADNTLLKQPAILRTCRTGWNQTAWNKLYKASSVRANHLSFKEGLVHEDNLWSFQIACLASSLYVLNHVTYIYKIREGSITYPFCKKQKVEALIVIIKEMSSFVDKNHINRIDVFPLFDNYFSYILKYYSSLLSTFVSRYKELRPFIKYPVLNAVHRNQLKITKYLKDIHYLLPLNIAPYWHYYIYHHLFPFIVHKFSR